MGKEKFVIRHQSPEHLAETVLTRKGNLLLAQSLIMMKNKKPLKLTARFDFQKIKSRFEIGFAITGIPDENSFLLFPISEDLEWKNMIVNDQLNDFLDFIELSQFKKAV